MSEQMTGESNPLGEIWKRSATDREFRARLIDDPRTTLREEMGLELRDGVTVNVVENTDSVYTIVLPDPAEGHEEEEDEVVGFGMMPDLRTHDLDGNPVAPAFPRPTPGDFGFGSSPFRC